MLLAQEGGGGVFAVYMTGGPTELHIANPKKIHEPKILHPKYTWYQNFLPEKNTRLSTSILIYSIKQTLRPKKIHDSSLDPKNTEGVNFQPQKIHQTSPPCKLQVPPWGYM